MGDVLEYITSLTEWVCARLSTWEASKVFKDLTAEKAVKTPKDLGAVVRGALVLLVSAEAPENAPYDSNLEVVTASLTMEGEPGGETDSGVPFPWLNATIPLPERLQAILESVDNLADSSAGRMMGRTLPE